MGSCGANKNCIKSVFEAELTATSDDIDTAMYLSHLGKDLQHAVQHSNSVATDCETALNWIEGCLPSKSSRHGGVMRQNGLSGTKQNLTSSTSITERFPKLSTAQMKIYNQVTTHHLKIRFILELYRKISVISSVTIVAEMISNNSNDSDNSIVLEDVCCNLRGVQ